MRNSATATFMSALVLALCLGCKPKDKAPVGAKPAANAVTEIGAALGPALAAAAAKDPSGIYAHVDAELAVRIETAWTHATCKPQDRLTVAEKGAARVKDAAALKLKADELKTILARAVPGKECAFQGEVAMRTPLWPTKKRTGWEHILETGRLIEHIYDASIICKNGYNLQVRVARRAGQPTWKIVNVTELPFGVTKAEGTLTVAWD